jgi:hypothetical protein
MSQTWTVYSVRQTAPRDFEVTKTRWTEDGVQTDTTQVVATLTDVDQEAAEERARGLQRGYDRVRGQLPVPAAGEKL